MHGVVGLKRAERAEKPSEKSEKVSEISEAMRLLRAVAEPCPPGEHTGDTIRRISRALKWKEGRAGDIWYGQARIIRSGEMDSLRAFDRRIKARVLSSDFSKHYGQLAALRAQLQASDPEFHRANIDAITFLLEELQQALQR